MWWSEQVRPGIWVGFTDTTAGNLAFHVGDDAQAVTQRRSQVAERLAAQAGLPGSLVPVLGYMNQVHGADVADIDPAAPVLTADAAPTVDAMVTVATPVQAGGVTGLAVMVADCVPVVLVGETSDGGYVMGVAHAGRPGVEKDVIGAVVTHMRQAGAVSLEAWLGPSVCGHCYEVPEDMRATVAAVAPASYSTTSWGTPALDLPAAVLQQLASHGATAHGSGICTLEDSQYYSHRRAQRDGESEGRFIGLVAALSDLRVEPLKESASTP